MAEIKTREKSKGIKALDKAVVAGERMKRAFVRSKDQAENLLDDGQISPSEYAEDKVRYMAEDTAREVGHEAGKLTGKAKSACRSHREAKRTADAAQQDTPEATVKKYLTVQTEGNRQVSRSQDHYNLQMIIAVGFKINNQRAVQFRKWAGQIVKDHTIQGWTMDVERLKKGHMFTDEYFERQLQQIREIRLSERKFYQKVTDLYATAFDYDKDAKTTRQFFRTVQNKMHFAVHRHTAAELIVERADASKEHMGLTTWENAPEGKILKADVTVAKNYLSTEEMRYLERIVSLYLDYAELQAERKIPMSMEDWAKRLDGFLEFNGNQLLTRPGKISAEQAKLHAETEYEKYRIIQDRLYESDFDRFLLLEQEVNRNDQ